MKYAVAGVLFKNEPGIVSYTTLLTTHHHCNSPEQAIGEFMMVGVKNRPGFALHETPLVQEIGTDDDDMVPGLKQELQDAKNMADITLAHHAGIEQQWNEDRKKLTARVKALEDGIAHAAMLVNLALEDAKKALPYPGIRKPFDVLNQIDSARNAMKMLKDLAGKDQPHG